ncbi:uncharacterized protein LOC100569994 [Acyrthosiphon pisum]|uniref:Secreted protein n=1 Tax=Acyrthosiphon pisum TaxID=7029 RepID=A0A8R2A785_ACYPI|nr:uncharacterized protein LOC100569994 [Acyrthosiphon pisum]|eukprot:XP_003248914.2 PREDICTED: uncharacterized protein LOC100569994 [Acyrthosiphon pisum]
MIVSRRLLSGFLVIALTMSVLHNATAASASGNDGEDDGGGGGTGGGSIVDGGEGVTPSPSLMDRVSGVVDSVKMQASETLDGAGAAAGNAASVLSRLQPSVTKPMSEIGSGGGGGMRITEKKLPSGDNALGRLQETKGRTVAAAKKVMDETIHKLQSTVSDIRRTISGDDRDDVGGDRRISNAMDSLLRAVGTEGKAMFEYASDVINETADRAKAAVDKAQQQQKPVRRPNQ